MKKPVKNNTRSTPVEDTSRIPEPTEYVSGEALPVKSGENTAVSSSSAGTLGTVITGDERAQLQWEYEQFLAKLMFFLDLGWKAVGLFYAVLGGILAIYFTKDLKEPAVVKFLLYAPLIISISLSLIFFGCGILWWRLISKVEDIVEALKMTTTPNFRILTSLFWVFAVALGFTAWALSWLIGRLI